MLNNEESMVSWLNGLFPVRPDVALGIGDDAAALEPAGNGMLQLAAADQVVENVHFTPDTPPEAIAAKLLNRNVSDIAAMGGTPTHALVTLALNPISESFLRAFHEGLRAAADRWNTAVIGGDVTTLPMPGKVMTLTILGTVRREALCCRSAAHAGDFLYMTGEAGNSFQTGHHLTFTPRVRESAFLAGNWTHAMIDVSDGVLKDAQRMADASGVDVELCGDRVPLRTGAVLPDALSDGEDYELLFAVSAAKSEELERAWPFQDVQLTRIGVFRKKTEYGPDACIRENNGYDCFTGK